MSALDTLDLMPYLPPRHSAQERLVDAWRLNAAMVDQDMIFIGSHTRTLARRGKMMSDGKPMHSERYLAQVERELARMLPRYVQRVRLVSELEQAMVDAGIAFVRREDAQ